MPTIVIDYRGHLTAKSPERQEYDLITRFLVVCDRSSISDRYIMPVIPGRPSHAGKHKAELCQ
jgi:hypothetical protein